MAERRMMAKSIIKSDQFLEMPMSSQLLYFHLLLDADDDGFINAPKSIMRVIGAKDDDMRVLQAKGYTIPFDSGVIVIKHWRMHNSLRKDRYNPNPQLENERKQLIINDRKEYELVTTWQPTGNQLATNGYHSIGKDSIGKASIGKVRLDKTIEGECEKPHSPKRKTFTKPTIDEIQDYCIERNNNVNAEQFYDYYESNGWKVGKNAMKDWKACVRTWERNGYDKPIKKKNNKQDALNDMRDLMNEYGGVNEQSNEPSTEDTRSTIDIEYRVEH